MKVSSPVMNTPYSRSENKARENSSLYRNWIQDLCNTSAVSPSSISIFLQASPMGARSTRFITLATCSSRLSGSGNLQNCTYRPKLEKRITIHRMQIWRTTCAFVFSPFNVSPLHFSQKRSSSFFSVAGDLPRREAPGISSSVSAREAAIRDDQNTGKSRPHWLASLASLPRN